MATKNERAIATALGLVVGYCGARLIINKVGLEGTEKNKFLATFALAVGGLGYVSSEIFGTPNDTVNYFLLNEANNITNIHKLYNIVKNDQETYGLYASNNCWTPKFTDTQLLNFTLEFDKLIYNK